MILEQIEKSTFVQDFQWVFLIEDSDKISENHGQNHSKNHGFPYRRCQNLLQGKPIENLGQKSIFRSALKS